MLRRFGTGLMGRGRPSALGKMPIRFETMNTKRWHSTSSGDGKSDDVDARLKSILENIKSQMEKRSMKDGSAKMAIGFTCTYAGECNQTSSEDRRVVKLISKKSYESGVVLIHCPCSKLHLIADNLGWFDDVHRNIEDIMKAKGEEVVRLRSEDLVDIE